MKTLKILSRNNPKTEKGEKFGYLTYILHLAPHTLSGYNTCPKADSCALTCLNKAGRGGMIKRGETTNRIQQSRISKTKWFFEDRKTFMDKLVREIENAIKRAAKYKLIPTFRLNGTSDIPWEKIRVIRNGVEYRNVMEAFPNIQFYDYTKIAGRKNLPNNYYLTFSRGDNNEGDIIKVISNNSANVAVVFDNTKPIPNSFMGRKVIDGDKSDLRFLDENNVIVGLKAKGPAKKDNTGFVVR